MKAIQSWLGAIATILLCLSGMGPGLRAQDEGIVFEARVSKTTLGVNERLKVTFSMNKDGDNFSPPDFTGFDVIMGPTQYLSSSYINGKRSFSKSYSYTLRPQKMGSFTLGQATITLDGKVYKTSPLTVTITKAVDNPDAPPSLEEQADKEVFLVAEVSDANPYLNQAIQVTYTLYISQNAFIDNFNPIDEPKYPDFWSQDIPIDRFVSETTTYKGQPYQTVVLKRAVLYPQKTGKLTIEPMAIDVLVRLPTNRSDFWGRRQFASVTKRLTAPSRSIEVKPLPERGRPASFNGAVGQFEFAVSPSRTSLESSESFQVEVSVRGKGNLKLFQLPELVLPSSLEVYEPELSQDVRTLLSGQTGSIAQKYTVIPQYGGRYPVPPLEFSYFDPARGAYVTLSSEEFNIAVNGPAPSESAGQGSDSRNYIDAKGLDTFHFIQVKPRLYEIKERHFLGSPGFYTGILGPLLLIPLLVWWNRRRKRDQADEVLLQRRKSQRLVRKYLSEAKSAMDSRDSFYIALEKALYNYVKSRLQLDTVQISKEQIREEFSGRGIEPGLAEDFVGLLETCEMARYSPLSEADMRRDYDLAAGLIPQIDKGL